MGDIDPAQSGYWSVRESFVSFVLTNLPMVYPLFRGIIEKTRNSTSRSKNSQGGYRLDSVSRPQKGVSQKHPLTLPNDTAWGSKEQIVAGANPHGGPGSTSSGDEVSVGLPIHRPSQRQAFNKVTSSNKVYDGSSDQLRSEPDPNRIVVTKEYTVTGSDLDERRDIGVARY